MSAGETGCLEPKLAEMLAGPFADLAAMHRVAIRPGRPAKRRLGSIRRGTDGPVVTVNPLLLDPSVPEYVLEAIIAHELCHLAHGFGAGGSPPKHHPHRGGVVDAEIKRRGLDDTVRRSDAWIEREWSTLLARAGAVLLASEAERSARRAAIWAEFLSAEDRLTLDDLSSIARRCAGALGCEPLSLVEWLPATRRQKCLSYCIVKSRAVQLHGLLAHPAVPRAVVHAQISYWLARLDGDRTSARQQWRLLGLLPPEEVAQADQWQRRQWPRFREKHHPIPRR